MTLRIRQVVLAAKDLEPAVEDVTHVLGLRVAYRDPQVAEFGIHNAVMPIGDQFLEVISPMRDGTATGRHLARRGDSGYMIILQTDDFARDRARLEQLGVRTVWQAEHEDIRAAHLHPKDIGGAVVSIDQPTPAESWRWAGPAWREHASQNARKVLSATVAASDPEAMARRWAQVLGVPAPVKAQAWRLSLADGALYFVEANGRGEGLCAFELAMATPETALAAARSRGMSVADNTLTLCGTRFDLKEL